jgi:hypothetical protein
LVSTTAEASNGFLQNRIAARAARFVFIERLEQSRRQDHSHVSVVRLDVAAQLESAATGEKNVDDQQIGIDVAEAVHRRLASVRLTTSKPSSRRIRSPSAAHADYRRRAG